MTVWPEGLLAALAEALVASRLFAVTSGQVNPGLPSTWLFPLAVFSHLAGQVAAGLASRKADGKDRRTLLLLWLAPGACVGSVVFLARDYMGLTGVLIYVLTWMLCSARGIAVITQLRNSDAARNDLVWGTVVLVCVSFFRGAGGAGAAVEIAAFLLLCSALIVVKRRREITARTVAQDRLPWAAGGVAFVSLVVVAVLAVYLAGSGGMGALLGILRSSWDHLAIALGYLMTPVAYLVQWIIVGFQRVFGGRPTDILKMPGSLGDELLKQFGEDQRMGNVPVWLKWGALVLALACAGATALALVSRFYRSSQGRPIRETRVSLAHDGALQEWLQDAASGLKGLARDAASRLRSLVGWEPRTLEDVYAATIALLARRGIPRQPQLTPYEYRDLVNCEIPNEGGREALAQITAVFTECHYSERPPLAQELLAARAAYRQIADASFHAASAQGSLTRDPGG